MSGRYSVGALVPHTRPSALRPLFLAALPISGAWTTRHEIADRLHASLPRVNELIREARAGGLVERGPSIAYRKAWTYTYRLTDLGINRRREARRGVGGTPVSAAIMYAERLLPDRYEGLAGGPGPIDQACPQCGVEKGVRCLDMSQKARSQRRGAGRWWPRVDRPHRARRAWRGHGNNPDAAPALTANDRTCPACQAEPGRPCYQMNRWGRRLPGNPVKTHHHKQRTLRWVA